MVNLVALQTVRLARINRESEPKISSQNLSDAVKAFIHERRK